MKRAVPRRAALALWATLVVVGSAGVVVTVVAGHDSGHAAAQTSQIDPGAVQQLAGETPPPSSATPSATATTSPTATKSPASSAARSAATSTARDSSTPARTSSRPAGSHPSPHRSAHGEARRTGVRSSTGSAPSVDDDHAGGPVSISAPAAGIAAAVVPIGVGADGEVAIPENIHTVGWYRYSPAPPASAGSTVLVGHVDSAVQGEGAFFTLRQLGSGDRITLRLTGGRTLTYRVVSRAQFPKTNVPLAALFSVTGSPRLTLITCGGSFNATIRSYRDNIVITAVPV